jgi:hypothetical protein
MRRSLLTIAATATTLLGLALHLPQCGGERLATGDGDGGPRSDARLGAPSADAGSEGSEPCDAGWSCAVDTACGTPTTLTGKVFDPAGLNPLVDVAVFVPDDAAHLPPISPGSPQCSGATIADYVTGAATDATGSFTLTGVPVGSAVPVTVQIGKWRRTVTVNVAQDCGVNHVADGTLRLPRNRSEGDMPQMALLTGGADNLACFLLGIGVDPSELTAPGAGGSVSVYRGVGGADLPDGGAGDCTGSGCALWATPSSLDAYDAVLLGCEGGENLQTKPALAMQSMHDWLAAGGRFFGVHSQDAWFSRGPADFQRVASWVDGGASGATGPFQISEAIPVGQLLAKWAQGVGAADADGGVPLVPQDVATSVSAVDAGTVAWIHDESTATLVDGVAFPGNVKALTLTVPSATGVGSSEGTSACGGALLTDIHPGGTALLSPIPSACTRAGLSAEEKVLEFLFFREFLALEVPVPVCECPPPPPPSP